MKKIKTLAFGGLLASTLFFSTQSNARIIAQYCHIFADGCIGTHTIHSFLGFQWETYEVVACPETDN
jgi:hypothetical protein